MKFSVCIPNYNYAAYVGQTIESVLRQTYDDLEIIVSDNASTDASVDVIRGYHDPRIKLSVNRCNVGFAGNLDRAARQATGEIIIMLSSDDVMLPDALETYARLIQEQKLPVDRLILGSSVELIDGDGRRTGEGLLPWHNLWREEDRVPALDASARAPVYRTAPARLLERSLRSMSSPFYFCTTAYSRALYETVEGYGGGRCIVPDKWFHWRVLTVADEALFVRRPLFQYRSHAQNQTVQQTNSGALKYLVDEYLSTFELSGPMLSKANLSAADVQRAFIEYDIVRAGLKKVVEGRRDYARRAVAFGRAAYPHLLRRNRNGWALRALLWAGPLGSWVAKQLYARRSSGSATT